jgi:hypothetical protein
MNSNVFSTLMAIFSLDRERIQEFHQAGQSSLELASRATTAFTRRLRTTLNQTAFSVSL